MKDSEISSNKRVTKNATMLAFRMVLVTLLGLVSSRIVLNTLGVEDYGVYAVAGSFIGMIGFLNSTMAGTTNRFLCVEMGKGNETDLNKYFSSALIIHIIIAILVFILSETLGLWFLNNELKIPSNRMYAANWVYQCSILSVMIGITQTPYSAVILANEKMSIYAYFEIISVALKLLILFLLIYLPGDKLIIYSILILSVSIIMQVINRVYCIKNFKESKFRCRYEKKYFIPLLKYSTTDLFGNICIVGYEQSRPILINLFFGVIYNTANSLAYTVQYMFLSFSSSITQAFKPQIIKLYAQNNIKEMQKSMENTQKFNSIIFAILSVPFIFEAEYVLKLWLGEVPPQTILFLRIILISSYIAVISGVGAIAIHATGKIKTMSYTTGSLYISIPLITLLVFYLGAKAYWMYLIYGIVIILIAIVDFILVKRQIPEFTLNHFSKSVISVLLIILLSSISLVLINCYFKPSVFRAIVSYFSYFVCLSITSWFTILSSSDRKFIVKYINNRIHISK